MNNQRAFEIPFDPIYRWENFFVSPCNAEVVELIRTWPNWTNHCVMVVGDRFSGKTHLAQLWQRESQARIIYANELDTKDLVAKIMENPNVILEDLEAAYCHESLLNLYNLIRENQGSLLITTETSPASWDIGLNDLKSRLLASPCIAIGKPDDGLLEALLLKRFSDRQLKVPGAVLTYLVKHIDRSYEGVERVCHLLDQESLERKRGMTLPFVRELLHRLDIGFVE